MANALTLFEDKSSLPAHIAGFMEEQRNIPERVTTPTISYEGKTWSLVLNGERTRLMRANAEGDQEPVTVLRVVVLGFAPDRGRAYYKGAYNPNAISQPDCWSDDGKTPDQVVKEPQHHNCRECPMSAKNSKTTEDGRGVVACSQHRMVAVVPLANMNMPAFRMKLAITSLWDKTSDEHTAQKWFAFDNYIDYMRANNIVNTAVVVTKMKFDVNVAYPKILFSGDRWLNPEELDIVRPRTKSTEVKDLLSGTYTPASGDGVDKDEEASGNIAALAAAAPEPKVATVAPKPKPVAKPAAVAPPPADDDDGGEEGDIILPGTTSSAPAPAAPTKAAKPAAAAATAGAPPAAATNLSSEVADLLATWGATE